jgi:hypothetical protein
MGDVRFAIKILVEADLANDNAEESNRASITNKYDKAHLLHLQTDPTAAALWSAALQVKNRTQLDDCDGQGGTVCSFDSLASLFNDPTVRVIGNSTPRELQNTKKQIQKLLHSIALSAINEL